MQENHQRIPLLPVKIYRVKDTVMQGISFQDEFLFLILRKILREGRYRKCQETDKKITCFIKNISISQYEMLFLFKFLFEKYQPDKKQINGQGYGRMIFNLFPGGFHFFRPVNIVKNNYCIIMFFSKALRKIAECWFFAVVPVYKNKISPGKGKQDGLQGFVKISRYHLYIIQGKLPEVLLRHPRRFRATLEGNNGCPRIGAGKIGGG